VAPETTRAIYVRMSDRLAGKIDKAAERLGVTKRDVLSALVDDHLDVDGDNLVVRLRNGPTPSSTDERAAGASEVLTLEETAALLRVPAADVLALIEAGELPARRVGEQWRLARSGVLDWLRGDGPAGTSARRP
jgi:excisionase family DNA binding protein